MQVNRPTVRNYVSEKVSHRPASSRGPVQTFVLRAHFCVCYDT